MPTRKTLAALFLLSSIGLLSAFTDDPPLRNFKVLPHTLKDEELDEIMEAYNVSLGVECSYCHTEGDMADDSKAEKRIARDMMVMTNEINEKYFGKNSGTIGCMTCHNGKVHP